MTSRRSLVRTSFTSCTERSWPTASGVTVLGNATMSRSGSTGTTAGRFDIACAPAPSCWASGVVTSINGRRSRLRAVLPLGGRRAADRHLGRAIVPQHRQLHAQDAVVVRCACVPWLDVDAELDP